jgi:hypothetical protein
MSQILPKVSPPSITDMVHFDKPQPVVLQPRLKTIFVGIFVFASITCQSQKPTDIGSETGSEWTTRNVTNITNSDNPEYYGHGTFL